MTESNFKLRDYQIDISNKGTVILNNKGFLYLSLEVRTGKTLISLQICENVKAKKVLFITKIKAFSSIKGDYDNFSYNFDLTIINKESIHKIESNNFDVIICDEAHGLFGTFPKPNNFTKIYKKRFHKIPVILLSGTMSPESYSQLFHQFWINDFAPFKEFANFYKWAHNFVNIKIKYLGYANVNDYSDAQKHRFWHLIKDNILTYTQSQAGFSTTVNESTINVKMKPITYAIIEKLHKDLVVTSSTSGKMIIADTGAKLQQKTHQLFSGTIKFDDGSFKIIDNTKAEFIKERFKDFKIAIYYNFIAELEMLKQTFGQKLSKDLEEFNNSDKWIALQIVSGREGISLAKADHIVFMNIQFSAVSYFQAKDRMTTMARKENSIYWIFAERGIEEKIYKRVMNKKSYTNSIFKKDFNVKFPNKSKSIL